MTLVPAGSCARGRWEHRRAIGRRRDARWDIDRRLAGGRGGGHDRCGSDSSRHRIRVPTPGAERLGHRAGIREAVGRLARQRAHDDRLESGGLWLADGGGGRRVFVEALEGDGRGRIGLERTPSGQHLEEDDPEGVDVGRAGDLVTACLFGAEVVDGPEGRARDRHRRLGDGPGDAEVGDLHVPAVGDEDVARLHVAVDDSLAVGDLERAGHADGDADRVVHRKRAAIAQDRGQVSSVDELHDDVLLAIGTIGAVVIDADDVRVGEAAGGPCLLLEASGEPGI